MKRMGGGQEVGAAVFLCIYFFLSTNAQITNAQLNSFPQSECPVQPAPRRHRALAEPQKFLGPP